MGTESADVFESQLGPLQQANHPSTVFIIEVQNTKLAAVLFDVSDYLQGGGFKQAKLAAFWEFSQ